MRILQIHNLYKHTGGEDVVADLEYNLLKEQEGIEIKRLLFNNEKLPVKHLVLNKDSYQKTEDLIRSFKPDILHAHNIFYSATPSVLKCAYDNNIPVVMTLHNYRLICPNGLLLREGNPCKDCVKKKFPVNSVYHKCFQNSASKSLALSTTLAYYNNRNLWNRYVDKFIVLSVFAKNIFLNSSLNLDQDKILIKPNSVEDYNIDKVTIKGRKNYVYIGRLSQEKGINIAIEAFNAIPNLTLNIIGSGPEEEWLKSFARKNIIFHGNQPKKVVIEKLKSSKALILPSICYEGLPNTVLEAFSTSTPVISSNIDNINTLIQDQITGYHFATGSSESLIEKVLSFEANIKESLYINAREKYLNHYTHKKNSISLLEIYKNVIRKYE